MKVKGWREIFHKNGNRKKAGVAVLIPDKINFKTKTEISDREDHCIMIKGPIQQKGITLINITHPTYGHLNI